MTIHPTAVVDPSADIHQDALIGPFCVVGPKVRIEAGVELRNHATVYGRASIGEGTVVFPGAVIAGDPQDLKYRGEDSEVRIGRNCRIHECATINKGTAGGGMETTVGDGCLIMAYAHIAHDCHIGDHVVIGNNAQLAGHVTVNNRAIVSGMVGVHHFVTIGELAFIGAMSGVRYDVPPYVMVEGYPAEPRKINVVGLRRAGWSEEDIRAAKDAFRSLYVTRNGTPMIEQLEKLRRSSCAQRPPVIRLCDWLSNHLSDSIKGRLQESSRAG